MTQREIMTARLRTIAANLNRAADGLEQKTLSHVDLQLTIDQAQADLKALPAERKYL